MLDFENLGDLFVKTVHSDQWQELQKKFNNSNDIYVLGHGGNLAIADHAAVDITRLSNGTKNAMCPGSAVVATSLVAGPMSLAFAASNSVILLIFG